MRPFRFLRLDFYHITPSAFVSTEVATANPPREAIANELLNKRLLLDAALFLLSDIHVAESHDLKVCEKQRPELGNCEQVGGRSCLFSVSTRARTHKDLT